MRSVLENYRCLECQDGATSGRLRDLRVRDIALNDDGTVKFKPIGTISTVFQEKRALPRQAILGSNLLSRIELDQNLFTNPSHSLEGLDEFSHVWIIYHFHKNNSHSKAKVAPPRLDGRRIGVFSSRAPHRPCPIGLSLVELDKIDDRFIYFKGTDMVDGTPVLDIKPYIPHYDNPSCFTVVDQNNSHAGTPDTSMIWGLDSRREAPDGEETCDQPNPVHVQHSSPTIKVPNWILHGAQLEVEFNETAKKQSQELGINTEVIREVLKSDPRSVYLRTRYGLEVYTFQLGENTVSVKFDDTQAKALVIQIMKTLTTEELGNVE